MTQRNATSGSPSMSGNTLSVHNAGRAPSSQPSGRPALARDGGRCPYGQRGQRRRRLFKDAAGWRTYMLAAVWIVCKVCRRPFPRQLHFSRPGTSLRAWASTARLTWLRGFRLPPRARTSLWCFPAGRRAPHLSGQGYSFSSGAVSISWPDTPRKDPVHGKSDLG
jgi:hypothetical protein